jgi:DNA modification methylase
VRHPTEKPLGLLREFVESSSKGGELVLDPCAGIGSTGVAAVLAGRRTIMVEKHEGYAAEAVERVRRAEVLVTKAAAL